MTMDKKIIVIGDSHVNFFGGYERLNFKPCVNQDGQFLGFNNCGDIIENFQTFHLGSALAYNLNRYNTTMKAREKIDFLMQVGIMPKGATVMFAFGEVDCRVHVLRQVEKQNRNYKAIVDDILEHYLDFLKFVAQNYEVCVWGPIASQKDNNPIDPQFPRYGSEYERNLATAYFNEKLKLICKENDFHYFSIFNNLIDRDYRTKLEYIADGCHLSQRAWIFAIDEFSRGGYSVKFKPEWYANFNQEIENIKNISKTIKTLKLKLYR